MGVSSDGILYFGFVVCEEGEEPSFLEEQDDETEDFEDFICRRAGVAGQPYEVRKKAIDACPADLFMFCSYDYPMYILGVRGSEYRAYRGDAIPVDSFDVSSEKIQAFRKFCEEIGVEYQEPQWLLCSMYG